MKRRPPALLAMLLLIAAAKMADQTPVRAVLLGMIFVVGCGVAGSALSAGRWAHGQTVIAATIGVIVVAWISGRPSLGLGLVVAALLLVGHAEGRSLLHRASVRLAPALPVDRMRGWWASSPAPAGGAVPTPPRRAVIFRDLALVFAVALGLRGIWAVVIPPWQAPDEQVHYTYTAYIVDQGEIPHPQRTDDPAPPVELLTSWRLTLLREVSSGGTGSGHALPYLPIQYNYAAARAYRGSGQDRHSAGPLTDYPPLYYLYAALPYWALRQEPIIARLFAIRYASACLGALSCVFAYLIAYELRRERRWGLALGLGMALMPMYVFITSVANNDAALDMLATALIWLTVRTIQRQDLARPRATLIGATSGLALLIKPLGLSVIIVTGMVILGAALRAPRPSWHALRDKLIAVGLYATTATLVYAPWVFLRYRYYREVRLLSVPLFRAIHPLVGGIVVSAAMPAVSGQGPPLRVAAPLATANLSLWSYLASEKERGGEYFRWLLIKSFWGNFGWLDAPLPDRIYLPIAAFCAIGGLGMVLQMFAQPARRRPLYLLAALLLGQALFLFIGVDYYEGFVLKGMEFGLQGRYFFPVLAPFLFVLLSGWDHLWGERPLGLPVAIAGMAALQVVGLATVLARYYGVVIG